MSQRAETCTARNDFIEGIHFLYTLQYLVASSPVSVSVYITIPGSIQSSVCFCIHTLQYLVASSPVSVSVYITMPGSIQSSVSDDDSMAAGVFFPVDGTW